MGYRIFPTHRRLKKENVKRFIRRMKNFQQLYKQGEMDWQSINKSVQSWIGHACHADSYRLRKDLFKKFVFVK